MATRTIKAVKGLTTDILQYVVLIILQIFLAQIILRVSGQEVLGAYAIVMQVIGYGLVLDFGLGVALNRYLAQSFSIIGNDKKFAKVFNAGRYFMLVTNALSALLIITFALNITIFLSGTESVLSDARIALFVYSGWTIARTPLVLYGNGLRATQNMATANLIGLFSGASRLFLSIGLVYSGFGLVGLVIANVASECMSFLLNKFYFQKLNPSLDLSWRKPDVVLMRELMAFGVTYWGVNVAIVLTVGSDSLIVGHLYGAAAAAVFYTTKTPSFLLTQLLFKISDNAGPAINQLVSQGNVEAVRDAYLKVLRYSMLVAFPLAIGIICFNKSVIGIWLSPDLYAGQLMSLALAFYVVTQVINHINAMITVAIGNMKNWMLISISTGVMTVFLGYVFGKLFGLQWVMVAIAVMDIPMFLFLMYRSFFGIRMSSHRILSEAVLPAVLSSIPLIVFVGFIFSVNLTQNLSELIVNVSIFCAIFVISCYRIGLTNSERLLLRDKLHILNF